MIGTGTHPRFYGSNSQRGKRPGYYRREVGLLQQEAGGTLGEIEVTASATLDEVSIQYSVINYDEVEIRMAPKGNKSASYISLVGTEGGTEHLITRSTQALLALRAARAQAELDESAERR